MDNSLSMPAAKRKKMPVSRLLLDSSDDSSSDDDILKSSPKKPPSSQPSAMWKIDRLKTSLLKPSSESKDRQPPAEPKIQKQSKEKPVVSEECKDKARKEEMSHAEEKHEKKPSTAEMATKTPTHADDRSQKDASSKTSKLNEQTSSKPLEKGNRGGDSKQNKQTGFEKENRSDGKQRQTYVIPKLKKPTETTPKSTPVVDTWSDMLRRGAELEKNRFMMTPNSSGMRRIPKIPKAGLSGHADVGVLDKIEKHPGFLKWEHAAAAQRNMSKTDDERKSVAAKNSKDAGQRQQASSAGPDSSILSDSRSSTDMTPVIPVTATKSPLPMTGNSPATTSLLPTPLSARKKVLLPTPVSTSRGTVPSMSSRAIPVLVGRGKATPLVRSSPAIDNDTFVPDDTVNHPG